MDSDDPEAIQQNVPRPAPISLKRCVIMERQPERKRTSFARASGWCCQSLHVDLALRADRRRGGALACRQLGKEKSKQHRGERREETPDRSKGVPVDLFTDHEQADEQHAAKTPA